MMSLDPIGSSSAQVGYYAKLGTQDYYLSGGEPPGHWWGQGAEKLGLRGIVQPDAFSRVLRGFHPTTKKPLVQNSGDASRRAGFDLTWTPPKSVSVAWSQGDEAFRKAVETACESSLREAFSIVEELCGVSRRGKQGTIQQEAGLIAAVFRHDTARAVTGELPDPNLHWHVVLANATIRPDGSTGAVDARELFRPNMKIALGTLFRCELSKQLENLGIETFRPTDDRGRKLGWFEVSLVPEKLVTEFSKRRREIVKWLQKKGLTGSKSAQKAALATRAKKESFKRSDLLSSWRNVGKRFGVGLLQLSALPMAKSLDDCSELRQAMVAGLDVITNQQARFTELELLRYVAQEAQCLGLGAQAVRKAVYTELRQSSDIVTLRDASRGKLYTTKNMLAVEKQLLDTSLCLSKRTPHRLRPSTTRSAVDAEPTLRSEQIDAIWHMTVNAGSIACVNGMAGTGKTFALKVARTAWEAEGFQPVGVTLAAKAAENLEDSSGITSTHLHKLLHDLEKGRTCISPKTVLVVDEAGMLGTMQLNALIQHVETAGAKLVLVGDHRQLQAIDAGAPFRAIAEKVGCVEMRHITRQRDDWARKAVTDMAAGRADEALEQFARRGLLVIAENRLAAMDELVSDWSRDASTTPNSMIFCGTRYEVGQLNLMCQATLREQGILESESIDVGDTTLHVGDRIVTTRNRQELLVRNGNTGTVTSIDLERRNIRVEFDSGMELEIDTDLYPHIDLAYASSTHRAQGQTVDEAFVLAGGGMTDREITYVQTSRARHRTKIYADLVSNEDIEHLVRQMSRSRAKDMAHDYVIEAG